MTWRVYYDRFSTSEFSDNTIYQKFSSNDKDKILTGLRAWIIFNNDPTFTDITMKIYNQRSGSIGVKVADSDTTKTKASVLTQNSAITELFFAFNNFNMKENENYYAVVNGTGYTGTASSHIGWMRAWPNPVYRNGVDSGANKLGIAPYTLVIVSKGL